MSATRHLTKLEHRRSVNRVPAPLIIQTGVNILIRIPECLLRILSRFPINVEHCNILLILRMLNALDRRDITETAKFVFIKDFVFHLKRIVRLSPFERLYELGFRFGEIVGICAEEFLEDYEGRMRRLLAKTISIFEIGKVANGSVLICGCLELNAVHLVVACILE